MMIRLLKIFFITLAVLIQTAHADFLSPDQAFQFQAVSTSQNGAELTWKIADGYYLYHDQIKVSHNQKALKLSLPTPQDKDDPTFGMTQVYYAQVKTHIPVQPNQQLNIQWQGCADSGLCYPVQRTTIQSNEEGLLPAQKLDERTKLLNVISTSTLPPIPLAEQTEAPPQKKEALAPKNLADDPAEEASKAQVQVNQNTLPQDEIMVQSSDEVSTQSASEAQPEQNAASIKLQWNNDQFFFNLLSDQNIILNLLVFLGLGILLAFLPCSLPLIPILSGILVQRHRGYRAAFIAGAFVFGLAMVYAGMGLAVSQLGYNFQRWFQSPIFIGFFALLFIVFAFNLFGAFQLSLPQGMLHRLDQWQQKQKGGTLLGALLMGMIAALIVGPCMSAPLAGALLFVSQLNHPLMGTTYLFVLGLGIGLPIFIASVFGSKYLPKPGVWMDRLKFSFGFVMLILAIYFVRPLVPSVLYFSLFGITLLFLAGYCLLKILPNVTRIITKAMIIVLSLAIGSGGLWHLYQAISQMSVTQAEQTLAWQRVSTADELGRALTRATGQAVIIDVYADWCVACQPIEHEVLPREDVQDALRNIVRIKLDITHYHPSQNDLLKEWQILGPPTMIMLDPSHQEQRELRLTGTFSASQLIARLAQLQAKEPQ